MKATKLNIFLLNNKRIKLTELMNFKKITIYQPKCLKNFGKKWIQFYIKNKTLEQTKKKIYYKIF